MKPHLPTNEWEHCTDEFLERVINDEFILSHCDADSMIQLVEELQKRDLMKRQIKQTDLGKEEDRQS